MNLRPTDYESEKAHGLAWRGVAWYVVEKYGNRWYRTVWLGPACRTNLGQCFGWWTRPDSNREPTDYESAALTIELRVLESHRSTWSLIRRACKSPNHHETNRRYPASTHRTLSVRSPAHGSRKTAGLVGTFQTGRSPVQKSSRWSVGSPFPSLTTGTPGL